MRPIKEIARDIQKYDPFITARRSGHWFNRLNRIQSIDDESARVIAYFLLNYTEGRKSETIQGLRRELEYIRQIYVRKKRRNQTT